MLADTVRREFLEETALAVDVGSARYVSESYDRAANVHFLSIAFDVACDGEPHAPTADAHVVGVAWVAHADLATALSVAVVREPLLAHLADPRRRYFGFRNAGITIDFSDAP